MVYSMPPVGLCDKDHRVRLQAIKQLTDEAYPLACEWLIPFLKDRAYFVRIAAIDAVGILHCEEVFDDLVAALSNATTKERAHVVQALAHFGSNRICQPLLTALFQEKIPRVRMEIIKALSMFSQEMEVVNIITACLTDRQALVRATSAIALAKMGIISALPDLNYMANTDSRQKTMVGQKWVFNSIIARQAVEILNHPENAYDMPWPD